MSKEKTSMSKNDKQRALVPRLRFPEFRDESGWLPVRLDQLADRVTTKNADESVTRVLTNSAEHGVLNQREYFDKDIATKGNLDGYYVVEHGDFVYNPRISSAAPVGPISRNNVGEGVMSPLYTVFRFNHTDTDFYEHYFKSTSWHLYLRSVSSTGARHDRMSISNAGFMQMPVPNPHPSEQQKIADCLSSLDDLIAAEGRKLAALRDHKKGLTQQLFPREGETRPRLRFPEFRDAGEWEEKTIETLARVTQGGTPDTSNGEYWDGTINWMTPAEMGKGDSPYIGSTMRTLTEEGLNNCSSELLPAHSVIVSTRAPIGHIAINTVPIAINQGCRGLVPVEDAHFLYYALLRAKPRLMDFGAGNTFKELSGSALKCFVLQTPSPPEQQKIADCLSALDALITAQGEKLDALRTHKRGLMQQLFPSPEELRA